MTWTNPLRDPEDRRLPRIAGPCGLVLFGVTGDLSRKKVMPAIYDLANRGLLPPGFSLVGFARRDWADQDFAQIVHDSVKAHARTEFREEVWQQLAEGFRFVPGDFDDDAAFDRLRRTIEELDEERGTGGNHAFYLSIPPGFFGDVVGQLKEHGLAEQRDGSWRRVVVEKPFGHDLESARELNNILDRGLPVGLDLPDRPLPRQGDGAEHPGDALRQRAVRADLELQLRRPRADHDGRGHRHRRPGRLLRRHRRRPRRDPEPPAAADVRWSRWRSRRRSTPRACASRSRRCSPASCSPAASTSPPRAGSTRPGWAGGEKVAGFLEEEGIKKTSTTETYAAVTLHVDTRRWAGVPFYLRTGKRLGRRVTEVAIVFKRAPHLPFTATATEELTQNALVIRVQPDEGMTIRFGSKVPGTAMEIRDVNMDFAYGGSFTESSPEAYERLILDVLLGDPPLFPRHEEVELSWKILDPILEHWAKKGKPEPYASGTWGPESADKMLARDGRVWRRPDDLTPRNHSLRSRFRGDPEMIELTDTNSSAIAAEFVRARTRAGSPAMGMVMTLIIVVDEDEAEDAMRRPGAASHEHPARVLGVILGDARGAAQVNAQVGTGSGWTGETALIRLKGEVVKHPESVVLPLLLPDSPVAVWWPVRPAAGPRRRPARRAGPAPDHRRGGRAARPGAGRSTSSAPPTPRATPTWPGPGSPRGGRCSPRRSTSTRSRSPGLGHAPSGSARAPTCWWPGSADRLKVDGGPLELRRARHHRGGARDQGGADPDRPARRQAGDVLLPRPAGPADRAQAARPPRAARPRSCAASTRTTCTPPPRAGCRRCRCDS